MSGDGLLEALDAAANGEFVKADGGLEIIAPVEGAAAAVVALSGHNLIASSLAESWFRARVPSGDVAAPMRPAFLHALGAELGLQDDGIDVLLAARGLAGPSALDEVEATGHPRVVRANSRRFAIRVFTDREAAATVILGRGLALRREVAVEVCPERRNRGLAARALVEARRLLDPDAIIYAQIAPGNAASLRAFLAAGFKPIGSEALFFEDPGRALGDGLSLRSRVDAGAGRGFATTERSELAHGRNSGLAPID